MLADLRQISATNKLLELIGFSSFVKLFRQVALDALDNVMYHLTNGN